MFISMHVDQPLWFFLYESLCPVCLGADFVNICFSCYISMYRWVQVQELRSSLLHGVRKAPLVHVQDSCRDDDDVGIPYTAFVLWPH